MIADILEEEIYEISEFFEYDVIKMIRIRKSHSERPEEYIL